MSVFFKKARENRIAALQGIVARNDGPVELEETRPMTFRESRRSRFSVIDGSGANPWQPEQQIAA